MTVTPDPRPDPDPTPEPPAAVAPNPVPARLQLLLLRAWFVFALVWGLAFLVAAWRAWSPASGSPASGSLDAAATEIAIGVVIPLIVLAGGFVVAWAFTGFRH